MLKMVPCLAEIKIGGIRMHKITQSYLKLQSPKDHRGNIVIFLFVFLDIMGIIPIISEPFSPVFFWPTIFPIIFIHLWALLYIFAPYKFELSYYLFMGVYGIINTYVFFMVIQKFLYIYIGINTPIVFMTGIVLLVTLLIVYQIANLKLLHSGTYSKLHKNEVKVNFSPVLAASGIGYAFSQLVLSVFSGGMTQIIILIFLFSIMSIITAFLSLHLHKYLFIRKNMKTVRELYPWFGLAKKDRKAI
ncbi:hypothetical protein F9U64_12555 [Gracilibacillus oryzae]|uniref:Uncharacterized protein n=1 Tax=Gracilibacillus oryzae TaxID=1672701 RepID=A0A7C8KPP2_9BACI|nr:hypothetical protein [Gracilibacillus oryzae]KAB8132328.1 hypothetical protein F9U64_12555 [Gracilibacillus oryzae]